MSDSTRTHASRRRGLLIQSLLTIGVCVAVAMVFRGSSGSLREIARSFAISLVFAVCTGALAFFSLPRIGRRFGRLRAPWNWTLFLAACVAAAVAGCLLSVAVLAGLGLFPLRFYWREFDGSGWSSIYITPPFPLRTFPPNS